AVLCTGCRFGPLRRPALVGGCVRMLPLCQPLMMADGSWRSDGCWLLLAGDLFGQVQSLLGRRAPRFYLPFSSSKSSALQRVCVGVWGGGLFFIALCLQARRRFFRASKRAKNDFTRARF